jgi:hypothetical protein
VSLIDLLKRAIKILNGSLRHRLRRPARLTQCLLPSRARRHAIQLSALACGLRLFYLALPNSSAIFDTDAPGEALAKMADFIRKSRG